MGRRRWPALPRNAMSISLAPLTRPKDFLFWASPLDPGGDFVPEDPVALAYLSQQVGNWLFGGLTTRTNRAQYFAMVLYGLDLAQRAIGEYGLADTDEIREALFTRWERFWALAVLESRGGPLPRGDGDAMRGIRGAQRVWRQGDRPLPLEFQLISRQTELGGLGAYLSSLRNNHLVFPGSLRPSPAAREILDAFWDEPGSTRIASYEQYAMRALDPSIEQIERRHSGLTLATVGEQSRLSSLVERKRKAQQTRLWDALFERAVDCTLPITKLIRSAAKDGVLDSKTLLTEALEERWGEVPGDVRQRLSVARAFGAVFVQVQGTFDQIYRAVHRAGWRAKRQDVINGSFSDKRLRALKSVSRKLLDERLVGNFSRLEVHGIPFLEMITRLAEPTPEIVFTALMHFHRGVQRDRRSGNAWIAEEGDELVLRQSRYSTFDGEPGFPTFKLDVVQELLADLGRR